LAAGTQPQTPLGELTALPDPLAGLRGPTSKGREGEERRGTLDPHNVGDSLTPLGLKLCEPTLKALYNSTYL